MIESRRPDVHLGRGFWMATAIYAILSIAAIAYWSVTPLSQWLPAASNTATEIDRFTRFLLAAGSALFIFVAGYVIYFAFAFRRRPTDPPDAIGVQVHGSHRLEFAWTFGAAAFVVLLSVISVAIWYGVEFQSTPGLVVEAIGHQWYYTFRYPGINGEVTQEMHVPVDTPLTVNVTSADVIHSFWVPGLRIKADMVPGLINTMHFVATRVGRYPIICTEFCGTLHGQMNKQVFVVDSKADFQKWYRDWQIKNAHVSNALPAAPGGGASGIDLSKGVATAGKALFAQKCSACHAIAPFEHRIVGPGLLGVLHDPKHPNLVNGKPATPADVAQILLNGYDGSMGHMPNATQNGLSAQDIANLVAYLETLK